MSFFFFFFFFQAEDGIRDTSVTGVQTCALPISKVPLHKTLFSSAHAKEYQGSRASRRRCRDLRRKEMDPIFSSRFLCAPEQTWSGISQGTGIACRAWFYRCAFR